MPPLVSVIIPMYGHRDYVVECLQSVLGQSFQDFEVILINDGSPDDSAEIVRGFVDSSRVRYIEQQNTGQAGARNRGMREAVGKYVAFLDDDDVWPIDKLDWQVNALEHSPDASMVYGSCLRLGDPSAGMWPEQRTALASVFEDFARCNWITSPGQNIDSQGRLRRSWWF
jgi:glycosyltransferase involved in cell wall biosynthesis